MSLINQHLSLQENIMPQKKKRNYWLSKKVEFEAVPHVCLKSIVYSVRWDGRLKECAEYKMIPGVAGFSI